MQHSVFISYRRADTSGHAGRLSDDLARHFGRSVAFRDIDSIDAGADFVHALEQAIGHARACIVLIGDTFEGRARTRAMGINITGVTIVAMAGPIVSGLLAGGGTFRSFLIFTIGVPLFLWATRMPFDAPSAAVEPPLRHFSAAVSAMKP